MVLLVLTAWHYYEDVRPSQNHEEELYAASCMFTVPASPRDSQLLHGMRSGGLQRERTGLQSYYPLWDYSLCRVPTIRPDGHWQAGQWSGGQP